MIEKVINKVKEYDKTENDINLILKAYDYALKAHEGQYRNSGEPYIVHPVEVAMILANLELDVSTIASGLLHDVIEDTSITYEDIKNEFGQEIADLVDGVTKLGMIEYKSKVEQQAENMRKMLIAMAKDIRVIMIKLADRLHNMRTLKYLSEEKQKEKAQETLEIYAPIAHRLGMSMIKWELEDLSLRYLHPDDYYSLVEKVAKKRKEREESIKELIDKLKEKLNEIGIKAEVDGRPKHFYSIYKKMKQQNKTFEQIYDLMAVRVIVNTVKDCYGTLGAVHTLWKPMPGRFKDYIAMPKPNMYQSLHTTVIGPKGEPFEIQIRTWDMHRTAEYGIAAHWRYKEGKSYEDEFDAKLSWLRQLLEWQRELKDAKEFMETLKIDLFTDEVYVFTPKGDVISLPAGSTPIDFAYSIHTEIGHRLNGAKVNGKIVPIDYELKNGDIVEILTTTNSDRGPSRDWLQIVKSSQAKNKIRQWFKKEKREENIERGEEIFYRELKRHGIQQSQLKGDIMESVLKKLNMHSEEDLFAAIGFGGLALNQIIPRIKEELKQIESENKKQNTPVVEIKRKPKIGGMGVIVKGEDNVMVRFSKCCSPVPGDEIVGYVTKGRGVSIHRKDCPNIKDYVYDKNRIIEVEWDQGKNIAYQADIQIMANDRYGLLTDVTSILADIKISVRAVNARTTKDNVAIINLTLEITSREQLEKIMNKLKALDGVTDVYRISA
ncbi:MAG: diphosphokinase / guanosine-3,5-bis(diphosphate) 3-diphosphatase [Thermoanaerobacterium sp.]|uniref:GTP diphosphokinase n=1 Tax=Thermoanaerobacterium butyriciformans TaxID=1702242 RepID=A0ABS4NHU6_9THEO|nr:MULTISPECIES: bifunctional (p)ppGpp synthetase/guanosine-3',5'-bis(diphosphate) 3'-pyrophosphohydrolase [Thermoanaerobacterium]MDI3476736.1 diphosphokinase / guanosine-3,5-bis(diphosphate) 3-diphosphatase [Thermoanaerobacterium sp.]MBP2072622.1 GTP pyrophosphokinase [Thermoanaerobacterium butyriciformans]MDK2805701.1 diphosphokinase / guanosine-3,5-bis(diphosphate) 3-diphosphatase [Thermoanaerobacterium sp.]MDN5315955.1 diphosphokinase / guanosine-3,5-bis(diphosphate) 3-diphosphatase [Thermo